MNPQNGTGPAVLRLATGTVAEVRWTPQLTIVVDGAPIADGLIASVELHTKGELDPAAATLVFTLMGNPAQMRTALVTRACSAIAPHGNGDGFIATMSAVA